MSPITIRSKSGSFRRAGIQFTEQGAAIDPASLSEEQATAIFAEPNLRFRVDTSELSQDEVDAIAAQVAQPAGGVEYVGGKKPSPIEADGGKPAQAKSNPGQKAGGKAGGKK